MAGGRIRGQKLASEPLKSDRPDGIVLTATMLRRNKGDQVLAMDLDAIEMPVLTRIMGRMPAGSPRPTRSST